MRTGVVFPQAEIGADPTAVRTYVDTVEGLGYTHLLAYDHVVGADPAVHENWNGPYDFDTLFHEPFVLFGYLAAFTSLDLVTGIVIAPQRQTALLAKQAAEVDVLTGGRFRLGLGVGWNPVEYEALGQDFSTRGRRLDEQITLLRQLFTQRSVTFKGERENVVGAGLLPMPVQQPIPIWLGGASAAAYERMGRVADGWFPMVPPGQHLDGALAQINASAEQAGRDPSAIGMEGRVTLGNGGIEKAVDHAGRWRDAGATHISVDTMRNGFADVDSHLEALAEIGKAIGVSRSG